MTLDAPVIHWREGPTVRSGRWLAPGAPPPARTGDAGDATTAAAAVARARAGEGLVYAGDYHNARQLLAAMARRLPGPGRDRGVADPAAAWRADREGRRLEREILGRVLVPIEEGLRLPLRRAPDVTAPLAEALSGVEVPGLLPLRDLLGMIGAHEWRRRGVEVPALGARVHPHYGVYAPVRGEYVALVAAATVEWPVTGKRAFDVGTGTGVLAFVLARAGASVVVATDLEPRAVACARDNAARLGLGGRVEVVEADLFPPGAADLVVVNPPWLPGEAHGPLEHAVYDPGGAFLARLVLGLPARLAPRGEAWIVISDLAELLRLRPPGHLGALAAQAGLEVADVRETRPSHPRARDARDPLHAFRAREVTRLYRLRAR